MHYQPIIDLQTGQLSGFEALARWHHHERGQVPPDVFIPLAEEIGLIGELGNRVLRQACDEAVGWPSSLSVAVNLSAVQFRDGGLPLFVASALAKSGLAASRLELEITELSF